MKEFIKITLATLTAMLIAGFIFFIYGISSLISNISSDNVSASIKSNSVFVLDLKGNVVERHQASPIDELLGEEVTTIGLDDIIASIQKAKLNENIRGIHINAEIFTCAPASMQEIRKALADFKESGKFVTAYSGSYTQGTYYVSSIADQIAINPSGNISWHGLSAQTIFFKDLLDKLGINMQIFKVGTYKSAVEPFINTSMSEANKEQTQLYINSIWQQILSDVSQSRNIPIEELNRLADENLDFRQARFYIDHKMADTLMYKDQMLSMLKRMTGISEDNKLNAVYLKDMMKQSDIQMSTGKNQIAVYYAFGEINDGSPNTYNSDGILSEKVIMDLKSLRENKNIKAVVLRVNSPGGSAYASEQIWREVTLLKEKKPVIVSMGDYAASGGYYISCAADWIFAEPTTLTGSIGIFGMIPDASRLVKDKLGISFDGVKTNALADMGNMGRPFNHEERALIQQMINQGYELFVKRCANGRNMPVEAIKKIAEGRVWTGKSAQEIHLVDELGGLKEAIEKAAERADIDSYSVKSYPEDEDILFKIIGAVKPERYINSTLQGTFGEYYQGFKFLQNISQKDHIQARIPYILSIN